MGPVIAMTVAFSVLSFILKIVWEHISFWAKGNTKYRIIDILSSYIYYGPDIGVDASLALDCPSADVLARRRKGQEYLASKLGPSPNKEDSVRGKALASKLVDCRFALAKVCMPLLRELEFPAKRNFACEVRNKAQKHGSMDAGIFEVMTEDGVAIPYVGSDAVHTLGIRSFHAPLQAEINRRMALQDDNKDSRLRFVPITENPELEKNADLILNLTGMDQVREYDRTGLFIHVIRSRLAFL